MLGRAFVGPTLPWQQPLDVTLAFVNEAPRGETRICNVGAVDGAAPHEVVFVTLTPVGRGAELFLDYGAVYDRSGYV